ncbi:MAG: methyltransferase domain-containing protein [Deltaproteobacteria bacterium]|nr:MAG: methyltransferase domain-containing protein [Deltaproteobacteria bacterium]
MRQQRPAYKWFYDNIHSREYDLALRWFLWPFGGERRFRREMMACVPFDDRERILDLCCGTGSSARAIREQAGRSARIVGADLSIGQLRRARAKEEIRDVLLVEADASATPFRAGHFDTVVIPHALHEMPRRTRIDVLREARRLVRPEGRVVVLELDDPPSRLRRLLMGLWLGYWLPYPINFENPTRRDMVRRGVVAEMKAAGFERTRRISKFEGTMQVVFGWNGPSAG